MYSLISKFSFSVSFFSLFFYFSSSGTFQLGFMFFLFLFALCYQHFTNLNKNFLIYLAIFFFWAIFINLVSAFNYENLEFLTYIYQLFFGVIIFISVSGFLARFQNSNAMPYLVLSLCFILFLLYVFDFGRYYYPPRYNGFLNDPNQYGFACLCLCIIGNIVLKRKVNIYTLDTICALLIIVSLSRSALLGMFVFILLKYKFTVRTYFFMLAAGILLLLFINQNYNVFLRLATSDFLEELFERGMQHVINFPESIILGAGKGLETRFFSSTEIHMTPIATLFYFGVVGFFTYHLFLFSLASKQSKLLVAAIAAIYLYGLTTFNLRTPIFWVTLAFLYSSNIFISTNTFQKES